MALVEQNFPAPGATLLNARVTTPPGGGVSRLAQMQARFQQKQMQEKEQKLLRLYESQQQRAFQRVGRGGSGSSSSSTTSSTAVLGGGKVRSLFEERRGGSKSGWDRSYPLEPLENAKPKTNSKRGASLDRSRNQQTNNAVRRSKSHARGGGNSNSAETDYRKYAADSEFNQSFRKGFNSQEGDFNGSYRKHANNSVDEFNGSYRKQANNSVDEFNGSYRKQANNSVDDYNGSYRKPRVNGDLNGTFIKQKNHNNSADVDFNGSYRKQDHNRHYQQEYQEDEFNYERLGENVHLNGNENFTVLPDRPPHNDLFSKYQAKDVDNNDLLSESPPPELYNDELDDSFVFKKLPNVGGAPLIEDVAKSNSTDKFKTYNASKDKKRMSPPASEPKTRGPARRREVDVSPPSRPVARAAPKKAEVKSSSLQAVPTSPARSTQKTTSNTMQKSASLSAKKSVPISQRQAAASLPQRGASAGKDNLVECRLCKRRFAQDRIKTHEDICSKTSQKKRKEYDAVKHRVAGTEAECFVKKGVKQGAQKKQPEPKKADWRKKHEEFINTIRAAKEMKAHLAAGGKLSDLPPPPPLDTSDYVQCPHCNRRFNETAAERHIPRCATMLHNKPKGPPASKSGTSTVGAKRR